MPITRLPYLAAARVEGADAGAFLQAQLSADISGLPVSAATYACYCSPRGQVLALLLVCRQPDHFAVIAAASLLSSVLARLRQFVLRSQVHLLEQPEAIVLGTTGGALPAGAIECRPAVAGLAYGVAPPDVAASEDAAEWKASELRRGVAWLGPETSERFIPQMLGFEGIGAVSFSKGCYPGQEIVARARYLGQVKRRPLLLAAEGSVPFDPGSTVTLHDGQQTVEGVLLDGSAPASGRPQTVLFCIAPPLARPVEALEWDGRLYGCATI